MPTGLAWRHKYRRLNLAICLAGAALFVVVAGCRAMISSLELDFGGPVVRHAGMTASKASDVAANLWQQRTGNWDYPLVEESRLGDRDAWLASGFG